MKFVALDAGVVDAWADQANVDDRAICVTKAQLVVDFSFWRNLA